MLDRLTRYWVYGGTLAGALMLALYPLTTRGWPAALALTYLLLPLYMLHQYEEHDDDRFRLFINRTIGEGREVLSPLAVFIINVPGVWGVIAASTWLAADLRPGLGLVAAYLCVVNAIVHIAHAVIFRGYNPGLATAVVLLLPGGASTIVAIDRAGGGALAWHAVGLAIAIVIHAGIIVLAEANKAKGGEAARPA
ncbi:MAG TPA: HXXEE domain-containing protein [Gemmatimonadaceae bacterium]|nr:HXXEE domain-containing protein [Gemmatimonadaceae bacterium]